MTTDRALELAEALLHEERSFPRHYSVEQTEEALNIIARMRKGSKTLDLLLMLNR